MSRKKKLSILLLVLLPTIIVSAITFYLDGFKKYGTPGEYRKKQEELFMAMQDSIRTEEDGLNLENVRDSTLVGMEKYTAIFMDTLMYESQLSNVKTVLDTIQKENVALEEKEKSFQKEKIALEEKEKSVAEQQNIIAELKKRARDQNVINLAKIYDNMKVTQALPLVISMNETLAVILLSNMQQRNSAKLLGAVAVADVNKASKLNRLLAVIGTEISEQ